MAKVGIEDLSGTSTPLTSNPYDGILHACHDDPRLIQDRYQLHRITRNRQQKEKILSEDFAGWILDEHLVKLDGPQREPSYVDPRNCLVFWARPTQQIKTLINTVQQKLKAIAPGIWLMPIDNLHLTTLEVTHSLTAPEISSLVDTLRPSAEKIVNYARTPGHQARLVKPMISYDAAALALSFVPAAGECLMSANSRSRHNSDDKYTYHHFRRDIYSLVSDAGISVGSRYVVPSAHLTIARFNSPNPYVIQNDVSSALDKAAGTSMEVRQRWIAAIEEINGWLEAEFWPKDGESDSAETTVPGREWIVGDEKGLDFRKGTLWYGGGETVVLGQGI